VSNFSRVLRLALRHRFTVAASVLCSLGVALLWAGNIAAVLPIVDGVMQGKSIPTLIDETAENYETQIASINGQVAVFNEQLATATGDDVRRIKAELRTAESSRTKANSQLRFWQWFQPTAHRWLPVTPYETLVVVCLALFVGTVVKSVFRVAGSFYMARLAKLTDFELRKEFYRRTLRLDLSTFRQTTPGDLMNRFTVEVGSIALGTQAVFGMAIREPLKMIACLALAAWVSWQLLLLTVISIPLVMYAIYWLAKALKRANRRAQEEFSTVYEHLEETFSGIKVIKAFTMESHERSRFHQTSKQYYRRSMKIAIYDSLVSPITETMGVAIIIVAMLAGGYLVLNEKTHLFGIKISDQPLTHGLLGLFYASLAGASDPARRLSGIFNGLQRAAAASDRVYELLDRTSKVADPQTPTKLPARLGRLQFCDIAFSYGNNDLVLDGIDLQVEQGESIAIVGPNGCGKSTLMNLVARFYDPTRGSIKIDGTDIRDVRVRDLRDRIGVVTQETVLFDDTIVENIRYGSPGASDEQVIEAAKQAHAHRFITEKLSEGYQERCGTGGNRLSGGQRQRIALARAILSDPEILILDEATSQIDVESERLIHDVLEHFVQNRTAFMITHRPSTLALADRIVVIDHGRIVDVGTIDELSGRCELFRRLAHLDYRESA